MKNIPLFCKRFIYSTCNQVIKLSQVAKCLICTWTNKQAPQATAWIRKIEEEYSEEGGAAHLKSPSWYLPKAWRMMVITAMMGLTTQNWRVAWRTQLKCRIRHKWEWQGGGGGVSMKDDIRICLYRNQKVHILSKDFFVFLSNLNGVICFSDFQSGILALLWGFIRTDNI